MFVLTFVLVGGAVKVNWVAAAAVTATEAVCVMFTPLTVADTVLDSALVELNVAVDTPLEFVFPGVVKLLFEPLEPRVTVAPEMRLPNASLAVTVISEAVPAPVVHDVWHAVMEDWAAETVDCVAETAAGFTVTLGFCVIATPLIVADTVFDSAVDDEKVEVATPLELVLPGAVKLLLLPVELSTTVAP